MSRYSMLAEINRNIHSLAVVRYPWLQNIPKEWAMMVHFFENYKSGVYKCNSDGASNGNPGPSSGGFCIRNWEGEFIYAATQELGVKTSLEAEVIALKRGLQFCVSNNLLPETPWSVSLMIKKIQWLKKAGGVEVSHVLREGNKVADYFANFIFSCAGTSFKALNTYMEVPTEGKALIELDANRVSNLRVTKCQNPSFTV
ncbi:hypothetical protein R3W88_005638 [Solanum pinnatisectum]|uniref:RNase H type-1 domain-containing protein n=1 Tax=Solanum pinnatisectum TaxID=50273 RepID=A0AAV9KFA2_9SOLN|nr:hypothetical protein R3W88_005638 [Solanum pinnatisectum]